MAPAPPAVWLTAAPELRRTVAVPAAPLLIAWVKVIGPAVLTKSTSPLLVVTPVAPAAQTSPATVFTVKPLVSRKRTKAPAAVSRAAKLPVTVLATSHRSGLPYACTAGTSAVRAPASPTVWVTAARELRRTVAVLAAPVLTAWVSVIGPAVPTRSTHPLLDALPISPAAQTSPATVFTEKPLVSRKRTKAPAAVSSAAKFPVTALATSHRSMLPAATTARLAAVMAPAPPAIWVTAAPEFRRTVAVLPAPVLTAWVSVIGPAALTR